MIYQRLAKMGRNRGYHQSMIELVKCTNWKNMKSKLHMLMVKDSNVSIFHAWTENPKTEMKSLFVCMTVCSFFCPTKKMQQD